MTKLNLASKVMEEVRFTYGTAPSVIEDADNANLLKFTIGNDVVEVPTDNRNEILKLAFRAIAYECLIKSGRFVVDNDTIIVGRLKEMLELAQAQGVIKDYQDLCNRIGYSLATLALILNHKIKPTLKFIVTLCDTLGKGYEIDKWFDDGVLNKK